MLQVGANVKLDSQKTAMMTCIAGKRSSQIGSPLQEKESWGNIGIEFTRNLSDKNVSRGIQVTLYFLVFFGSGDMATIGENGYATGGTQMRNQAAESC